MVSQRIIRTSCYPDLMRGEKRLKVLADKNGVVIAGNKTLDAAQNAGLPIKEIHTTGEELVVVVRVTWTSRRTRKPANSRMRITAPPSWD